jgi:hypothetical protein
VTGAEDSASTQGRLEDGPTRIVRTGERFNGVGHVIGYSQAALLSGGVGALGGGFFTWFRR